MRCCARVRGVWQGRFSCALGHTRIFGVRTIQATIVCRLSHPFILSVEAVFLGSDGINAYVQSPCHASGSPFFMGLLWCRYIQMPWCDGGDLSQWSPPSIARAKEVLRQTLRVRYVQG